MPGLIGQSLGRYHILEQLGEGGMATVYKAYDTRLETDVAVKVIRTENLAPSLLESSLKRFEREAKSLARLTHPNIVKVTDYGEHEDRLYLVMPYLPGGTLKQKLGESIPWQEAARLLLPIARALDFAHRQNMIHRDVKPSNILITADGEPMLTDFGIAKILDLEETAELTGTGMGIGTPDYMAPEQWTGQTTAQSDQYSLGVVLYELLTGRKPYTADTPAAILLKQASEPLSRPSLFAHDLPDKVEKLLLKALARNPADRFADMGAFAAALESLLSGQTAPAKLQPAPKRELTQTATELVMEEPTMLDTPGTRFNTAPKKKKNSRRPCIFALGLLLVGLIVVGIVALVLALVFLLPLDINFTGTPATALPTLLLPTPTSQQPVQPSSLPQPTQPMILPTAAPPTATEISQFFTEEWDNGFGAWVQQVELNSSSGDINQAGISVEDGHLAFDLGKNLIAYVFFPSFNYTNVRIDARVNNRGTNVNDVLLVCQKSEEGHYLVNIANSGLYAMYAFNGARDSYTRIADGGSNEIKQGKYVNDYTLICNGRTLMLYINGTSIRSYTDNQFIFTEGQIGVGVASEEQLPVMVWFETVKISQP